jgi:LacI family transcriptional regulator
MRSTVLDVARAAGVSAATVDRVLNNRNGVRSRTRDVVLEAAGRLGYIADGPGRRPSEAAARSRVDFVLPRGGNAFMAALRREIELQAAARRDLDVRVLEVDGFNPQTLAASLHGLRNHTRGVGVVALDHPSVREAIRALSESGVKVVTLVSDILHAPRVAYVGIDNRQAGRLAGYVLGRLIGRGGGKVALFAGSLAYRGHEEREMGFRHVLAEDFPDLRIVELQEMRDDRDLAYAEASALLDRHPDLAGIYNIGAGNEGVARALKERGRERAVVFVGHDVTPATRMLLLDGAMDALVDQSPRAEAREALGALADSIRGAAAETRLPRLQIVFRENIPDH